MEYDEYFPKEWFNYMHEHEEERYVPMTYNTYREKYKEEMEELDNIMEGQENGIDVIGYGSSPDPFKHKYNEDNLLHKYNEDDLLKELRYYIKKTYTEHYSDPHSGRQALDDIIDEGHGVGYCWGNMRKYLKRYGKKGGRNRKDLIKLLHYGILLVYIHDLEQREAEEDNTNTELCNKTLPLF